MIQWPRRLLAWFQANRREMPWRGHPDPYAVWISEIMLQQTQVTTATPYFNRFVARWPTVQDLAAAPLEDVLKGWEGLGYYARARNLHKAANLVCEKFNGQLPDNSTELSQLPGIGPYTAAAIASICRGERSPVVDGNVVRVFTRVLAIETPAAKASVKHQIAEFLQPAIDVTPCPGDFNQAIMELGALVCVPRSPNCESCPLQPDCKAFAAGTPTAYPVKQPRKAIPHREALCAIVIRRGRILMHRRPVDALLGGMWEFPAVEQLDTAPSPPELEREIAAQTGLTIRVAKPLGRVRHVFSHFTIRFTALLASDIHGRLRQPANDYRWVTPQELDALPLPTAQRKIAAMLPAEKPDTK